MIKNIYKGIAVGITEAIPGISGSTILMILGIYERLIYSLSILTTNKRNTALPFLFMLGIGMVSGFTFAVFSIDYLLTSYRIPTFSFFIGIIVAFIPYLWKQTLNLSENKLKIKHYLIIFLFLCLVIFIQSLNNINNINLSSLALADYLFLVVIGMFASTALLLPGISGALILTIFNMYEITVKSLMALKFSIILPISLGVITGVLFSSKLIQYLLVNFKVETYTAMIGLLIGSIYAIISNFDGSSINNQTFILSLITFLMGIIILSTFNKIRK